MTHHNEFYSECQYVFKTRSRYGQKCNEINCKHHDEYNCNLARYLKLPSSFFSVAKLMDKDMYFFYKNLFERSLISKNNKVIRMASLLFHKFETISNIREKELIVIFSYKFIDKQSFLLKNERFKKTVDKKFDEFMLSSNNKFTNYMRCNFQQGKRFLSVQKNKEYRK